ncbi:MAG: hypothetical protein JRI68_23350 [Deltaproteobacteria bacterium]|nr:hypothetical protein [Deltaproteobacteria bacterium]
MTSDDRNQGHHPPLVADWAESEEQTMSVDELVTLSPTSVEAVLPALGRRGDRGADGAPESLSSLDELVMHSPGQFGATPSESPSSLEALFYAVSDEDAESWAAPAVRSASPAGEALALTRTSGFPAAPGPDADDLPSSEGLYDKPTPPNHSRSVAPVSLSAPLSLERDYSVGQPRARRLGAATYLAALVVAAVSGAWLSQRAAQSPTDSLAPAAAVESDWVDRALAAVGTAAPPTDLAAATPAAAGAGVGTVSQQPGPPGAPGSVRWVAPAPLGAGFVPGQPTAALTSPTGESAQSSDTDDGAAVESVD